MAKITKYLVKLNLTANKMTKIESKKVTIGAPIEECFNFLMDLNNYELLLPQKTISDWESTKKTCAFKIQKTYKLSLEYNSSTPSTTILLKSGAGAPFSFDLNINLVEGSGSTEAQIISNADINPFMKMMVKKPLNNLFDYMTERMVKVIGVSA